MQNELKEMSIGQHYGISSHLNQNETISKKNELIIPLEQFGNDKTTNVLLNDNGVNDTKLQDSNDRMVHFVTENLEEKLRTLCPQMSVLNTEDLDVANNEVQSSSSKTRTPMFQLEPIPQIDPNILNDIEVEAQYLATSIDNLTENLCNLLHSISSITADNVEIHKNAVDKLTDSIDGNIKCMYTIMAKTEEISKSMQPAERLGIKIREIKRLVDSLDSIT